MATEGEWVRGALNSRPSNKGATLLVRATCESQPAEEVEEVRTTSWATSTQGGNHQVGSPCGGQRPAPPLLDPCLSFCKELSSMSWLGGPHRTQTRRKLEEGTYRSHGSR